MKEKKTDRIVSFALPVEDLDKLKQQAKSEGRSMSSVIRRALNLK